MARQIFSYIIHKKGIPDDSALELLSAAAKIDPEASVTAVVTGWGSDLSAACREASKSYEHVWKVDNESIAYPDAALISALLQRVLPRGHIVLIPHEHFGMDLAPGLSIGLGSTYLPDVVAVNGITGNLLLAVREEFNGMVSTHVSCDTSEGAIITVRAGSFPPNENKDRSGLLTDKTDDAFQEGMPDCGRRFLELVQAEVGDVDITKSEVLVSVGRGIEEQENLEIIHELAQAMGADVSCSRPIVDAKWMEKSRQVGTSGQTVKPKVYMALGISGSFQHLGGIKGSPFIVAINKNLKAPIFQVADVGVVADILDFIPSLTEKINEGKK
ncbi:MAG: electron transfer flavoprotein subunit alpha [Deltaproteobacteria bacterium RBG_13_49_15]|nr:MAG: electron transfer flavoprotein subunit alpha [Deltaproteobacteria bacterium RBG_13_49_15]